MTKQDLINFESEVASTYATGAIRGPVHLRDGCEDALIEIFRDVRRSDYVLSTWASHLHALLHGVSPELIRQLILDGKSITLCFPDHRFYSSAIVGGIAPIAVGLGMGIVRNGSSQRVWAFIGDMAYFTGVVQEAIRYCRVNSLPVTFVVEDNGLSVCTPTADVWGQGAADAIESNVVDAVVRHYRYEKTFPHSGIGRFISFG